MFPVFCVFLWIMSLLGTFVFGFLFGRCARKLPVLDETLCTGCGDCVAVCPAACLEMAGSLPWLPRPADCMACALCEMVCPADAIKMAAEPDASARN